MSPGLIELLQKGDHSALKNVYEQWNKKVYFYFLKKANEQEVAKDLTQMTFVKLWDYRHSLTTEYSIEVQVFNKARFIYIDWLRKSANERKLLSEHEAQQAVPAPAFSHSSFDLKQSIMAAINCLPEMRRKVFHLRYIEGYSYQEIADFLGVSKKTVDNHLLQATRQMKKILGPWFSVVLMVLCR